jgi:hypothetical protein
MRGAIPAIPQYVFMAWCIVEHRDNFTFTFTFTFYWSWRNDTLCKENIYVGMSLNNTYGNTVTQQLMLELAPSQQFAYALFPPYTRLLSKF